MSKPMFGPSEVGGPTWVFAVRHAGRIAESISALAETWPIYQMVSPAVVSVGAVLHTASDEVPNK
jgi:hypothetical protein